MAVKLEVGKSYRNNADEKVAITSFDANELDYPFVGVKGCANNRRCTFAPNGDHCIGDNCPNRLIAEWSDDPEPEIDWGGELQIGNINIDRWADVKIVWHDDEFMIGWVANEGPGCVRSWRRHSFEIRNKPPEPKRVRGWVNVCKSHSPSHDWFVMCYRTRSDADKAAANDRFACIEIDVPEGEGLS